MSCTAGNYSVGRRVNLDYSDANRELRLLDQWSLIRHSRRLTGGRQSRVVATYR